MTYEKDKKSAIKDIVDMSHVMQLIYTVPENVSSALSGLTLGQVNLLRYLLLLSTKSYLSAHPAAFSLDFSNCSDALKADISELLPSLSSKKEGQSTITV